MTAAADRQPKSAFRITRQTRWLLIVLHVPFLAISPLLTIVGAQHARPGNIVAVLSFAVIMAGLQLRHSLTVARGARPVHWQWSLLALAVVVYGPMYWFGWNWSAAQILFIASAAMLLRSRVRICLVTAPILGGCLASVCDFYPKHASSAQLLYGVFYGLVGYVLYPAALYGAVRAVVFVDQLFAARAELARTAVERERLRVSRDLHDLLGHSLSAISLKGDLARKLLPIDADRAFSEIDGLTKVARDALHDMFAISKGQHSVSLGFEIEAAAGLLRAAGIRVSVEAVSPEPAQPVREVLAWAVREGATNVLRHSEAMNCSIRLGDDTGAIWLEIVNDGLRGPLAPHSGLGGLATRAEAVSGMVEVGVTDGGLFRLRVRIPKKKRDARPLPTPVDRTAGTPMRQPTRWQPS